MIRRLALPLAVVMLGVLLVLLAFLQYRWLGQVSDGERQRMRATLELRAREFATEFDRELGKAAAAFSVPAAESAADPSAACATRWDRWQAAGPEARLVREVFVIDRSTEQLSLRRYDPAARALVPAEWPEALRAARDRWRAEFAARPAHLSVPHVPTRVFIDDLSDVPALVVPMQPDVLSLAAGPGLEGGQNVRFRSLTPGPVDEARPRSSERPSDVPAVDGASRQAAAGPLVGARVLVQQAAAPVTVLWLDLDYLRRTLLPSLARRFFASDDVFDYQLSVSLRRDPATVFFESDPGAAAKAGASRRGQSDATVPLFRMRVAEWVGAAQLRQGSTSAGARGGSPDAASRPATGAAARPPQQAGGGERRDVSNFSVSVMRFEATHQAPGRASAVIALADASGGWLLRLVHRAGSLDAAVERLRRRNLLVSSSILGLLAVSLGFVLVSTRRAQRLAAQQVEFVASVSHELRTPLAVIRSAGENLADGVVDSPDQVRRYGALVAEEGRKLGTMVEQVMEYAGMQSDQPRWQKEPVDLGPAVDDAVAGARRLPQARGASIDVHVDDDLPAVEADRGAVVRAVQNLVENALKYGQPTGGGAQGGVAADDAGEAPGGRAPAWVGVRVTANGRAELRDAAGSHAAQAAGRECVVIEVSDRGPGIDAGERRRIFEPFVRGRAAASTRVPGNGLGLSIVRRVAEGHGGRVDVSSHAGGGATFRIELRA